MDCLFTLLIISTTTYQDQTPILRQKTHTLSLTLIFMIQVSKKGSIMRLKKPFAQKMLPGLNYSSHDGGRSGNCPVTYYKCPRCWAIGLKLYQMAMLSTLQVVVYVFFAYIRNLLSAFCKHWKTVFLLSPVTSSDTETETQGGDGALGHPTLGMLTLSIHMLKGWHELVRLLSNLKSLLLPAGMICKSHIPCQSQQLANSTLKTWIRSQNRRCTHLTTSYYMYLFIELHCVT